MGQGVRVKGGVIMRDPESTAAQEASENLGKT